MLYIYLFVEYSKRYRLSEHKFWSHLAITATYSEWIQFVETRQDILSFSDVTYQIIPCIYQIKLIW